MGVVILVAVVLAGWWLPTALLWGVRPLGWLVSGCPAGFVVFGKRPFFARAVGRHVLLRGTGWWRPWRFVEQLPRGNALSVEVWLYRIALAALAVAAVTIMAIAPPPVVTQLVGAVVVTTLVAAALHSMGVPLVPRVRPLPFRWIMEFEQCARDLSGDVHRHWARGSAGALALAGAPAAASRALGDLPPLLPPEEALAHHWVTVDIYRARGDTEGMRRAAAEMRALLGEGAMVTAAYVDAIADAIDGRVESLDAYVSALGIRAELGDLALRDLVRSVASYDTRGVAAALWADGASWGCDGWEAGARALREGGDAAGAFRAAQQALLVAHGWAVELDGAARDEAIPRLARLLALMEETAQSAKLPPPPFVSRVRGMISSASAS